MTLVLREPHLGTLPELDAAQDAIVSRPPVGRPVLVVGAPGTGKTTTAVATLLRRVHRQAGALDAPTHLLLAPTRRAAARCREMVAAGRVAQGPHATRWVPVQTPAAFAFSVLRALAVAQGRPMPSLITGAQQDRILAELLAGHVADGEHPWPGGVPVRALHLPAFRAELRNLFMRAAEFGLSPAELASRGRAAGRAEWVAAAAVLEEYHDVVSLADLPSGGGERYDASAVLSEAASVLADWEELTDAAPPRVASVIVDDYQEASAAGVRLLHALATRGTHVTLLGDPDVAVQTFRGARPQFLGRAGLPEGLGGFGAEVEVLRVVHRGGPRIRDVVSAAVGRVPVAGISAHRAAQPDSSEVLAELDRELTADGDVVDVVQLGSARAEQEWVARWLRAAHLSDGVPWREMAVIVRSGRAQRAMAAALRGLHVPVARGGRSVVLRDDPAVRPLLLACVAALDGLTPEVAAELVAGPLGGLDTLGLRHLRRELRRRGHADGLVAVLQHPSLAETLPASLADGVARAAAVLAAARRAASCGDATHQTVLWAAWEATGWARVWQECALAGGPGGERADDDLDAVMSLFASAETESGRRPGAHPVDFVRRLLSEDIPTDSLAPRGGRRDAVQVLTAAEAAGQEWDLVVVAGVQEDGWPDARVRDTLLGAGLLADLELGRIGLADAARADRRAARTEVVADEWRLFAAALSRARRKLVVTAVRDADQRPSAFFEAVGAARIPDPAGRLDLRGAVGALRALLDEDPTAEGAAALLALLARAGVAGADPTEWSGVGGPTTLDPVKPDGRPVRVSPSRVETVTRCPLRWALEGAGGRRADEIGQGVGTLVHEIAAEHPHGSAEQLIDVLGERFGTLGLPPGWVRERARRDAEAMLRLFADYAAGIPGEVRTEVEVTQQVGDAVVHGYVDRLEMVDGGVRVVDLKTGAPVSRADGEANAQLGVYQLALRAAGESSVGARLVHVTPDPRRRSAAERHQPPLPDDGGWAARVLAAAVATMRSGTFEAVASDRCGHCPVRRSCPVSGEGERCAR